MHLVIPEGALPEEQDHDLLAFWERILRPGP